MTWAPSSSPPDFPSFDQLDMAAAIGGLEGGGRWRKHQVFSELGNVGVVGQTIQTQGLTTVLPTVAGQVTLVGGATDLPAGVGARVVRLRGLRAGFLGSLDPTEAWYEEDVPLNGTNPVLSPTEFLRLFQIQVIAAGTNRANVGLVTGTIGGNLQVEVEPGGVQSKSSHVSVPMGWNGFATRLVVNWAANQPVRVECIVSVNGVDAPPLAANFENSLTVPIGATGVPPTTDIWCRAARIGGGGTDPVDLTVPFLVHRIK